MTTCSRCQSDRILSITGKCSDCCFVSFQGREHDGYVPYDLNIGGGDNVEMNLCLQCGQIQGEFPISDEAIEDCFNS
jgi:hypothetical protein